MGLSFRKAVLVALTLSLAVAAEAAPELRLSTTTVGPVFITAGQNGTAQQINAANIGDGSLNLTATSTATWTNVSFGVATACVIGATSYKSCVPVNIGLNTSALAAGSYTSVVTLTDPNAIDTPQNFTVTVQIGSAVPSSIDLYVAPGGVASSSFVTGSRLTTNVVNAAGGPVVSIAAPSAGSFAFSYSYVVSATAASGLTPNDYTSNIQITGSATPADNKTLPVNVHVTTQPIAGFSPTSVSFRIAQNAVKQTQYVSFSNLGAGTLTLSQVTGAPAWLTATTQGNLLTLVADPTGLSPGANTGTLTVTSNARNATVTIPVQLTVLAAGPPVIFYQGVVDNALFAAGDPVAPGGIVALFGEQLSIAAPVGAPSLPLTTSLGNATVLVNGNPVPIFYVSATQINFLMPYATPSGAATVQVTVSGQSSNRVSINVQPMVPRLLRLGIGDYPIAVINGPSTLTFPIPTTPGIASRPAVAGETLVFYALGLGQTTPPAQDGVAAPQATAGGTPIMIIGQSSLPTSGVNVVPLYAGLTPGFVGLYQINVTLPTNVPRGDAVSATFTMGSNIISNRVVIAIQ
jgi:uncharacterized protein (TIGR03437 family)